MTKSDAQTVLEALKASQEAMNWADGCVSEGTHRNRQTAREHLCKASLLVAQSIHGAAQRLVDAEHPDELPDDESLINKLEQFKLDNSSWLAYPDNTKLIHKTVDGCIEIIRQHTATQRLVDKGSEITDTDWLAQAFWLRLGDIDEDYARKLASMSLEFLRPYLATRELVSVSLEKCAKAVKSVNDQSFCDVLCDSGPCGCATAYAKAVLDAAGVKYHE
jgi:hypothetical protein